MTIVTRILIVEDHRFFSEALGLLLARRLSDEGGGEAEVDHAFTVAEGIESADRNGPFDAAVVDLMLPDGNGANLVREIKASYPATRVAVLSATPDLSGAIEAGADEAIHKSTPLTEIVAILAHLVSVGDRTEA
jgi:DNA-binding NarL/FixJ family response regulator